MEWPPTSPEIARTDEFEFVMGPRQLASLGVVVLTALAVSAGGAYMIGKNVGKVTEIRVVTPVEKAPVPVATETPTSVAEVKQEEPLEGTPEKDKVYLQVGSLEPGFARLITHGLRKLDVPSFLAPGASPAVFRVLAGPFKSDEELQRTKIALTGMGLKPFIRKYSEPAAVPK